MDKEQVRKEELKSLHTDIAIIWSGMAFLWIMIMLIGGVELPNHNNRIKEIEKSYNATNY